MYNGNQLLILCIWILKGIHILHQTLKLLFHLHNSLYVLKYVPLKRCIVQRDRVALPAFEEFFINSLEIFRLLRLLAVHKPIIKPNRWDGPLKRTGTRKGERFKMPN